MPVLLLVALLALAPASTPLRPADGDARETGLPRSSHLLRKQVRGRRYRAPARPAAVRLVWSSVSLRSVDGCPIPAVLSEGIGGRPEADPRR